VGEGGRREKGERGGEGEGESSELMGRGREGGGGREKERWNQAHRVWVVEAERGDEVAACERRPLDGRERDDPGCGRQQRHHHLHHLDLGEGLTLVHVGARGHQVPGGCGGKCKRGENEQRR
jgi:hypothetical protein